MEEDLKRFVPFFEEAAQESLAEQHLPRATYRLQLNRDFPFRKAQDLIPYFDDLGISHLYVSPLFKPCTEESSGYDVCDHKEFNPALGSEEEFGSLTESLRGRSMGLILDVVPNHMGISGNNPWWMDVLENGPSSPFSCYFDIDFTPAKPELQNKILLSILEDQYGKVLESGKFRLTLEEGAFLIRYYQQELPVAPRSYSKILGYPLEGLTGALGKENAHLQELQSILTAISYLPPTTEVNAEKLEERRLEKEVIKRRLANLYQDSPEVRTAIDAAVQAFNGTVGNPGSFELLDDLLRAQAYRPAFWRVAADEINYRRFFDINHLAAIRVEIPEVFREAHQLIFHLLHEQKISGLRIDHPDGLWNPAQYFRQLQEGTFFHRVHSRLARSGTPPAEPSPGSLEKATDEWLAENLFNQETPRWPLFVLAEKILGQGEPLPQDWAVYGTTGYEFLNAVNGLFVDGNNRRALDRIYSRTIGAQTHFGNLVNSCKKMIMLVSMAGEVQALSHRLERICEKNRWYRDFTLNSLTFALREVIAALPVYRTYITGPENVLPRDQRYIETAVEEAKRRNPRTAQTIFDFLRDTLLLRNLRDFPEEERAQLIHFVMNFQQITGPVMAKGLEDTAFYIYNRLVSLNEVGGNPEKFGVSVAGFHQQNLERQKNWPGSLLATSTHDTKRSEDVRVRIDVLSEIPGEWRAALNRWSRYNAPKKTPVDGRPAPDRNDEYLLYQTLVGAWPDGESDGRLSLPSEDFSQFRDRIAAYMHKATLEAKVHTSWINPNEEYDRAVKDFVYRVLEERGKNRFLQDMQAFQRRIAFFGQFNALSQVLLKLTSPGVPDLYQGTELWDLSLVDPDNRRPVDYQRRRALLAGMKERVEKSGGDLISLARELLESSRDGRIKLYLIYRTLNFRRRHPELFWRGEYTAVEGKGERREHLCAFFRKWADEAILVVVPRLVIGLTRGLEEPPLGEGIWKDTHLILPGEGNGIYRHLFTGETLSLEDRGNGLILPLASLLGHFPLALLERVG